MTINLIMKKTLENSFFIELSVCRVRGSESWGLAFFDSSFKIKIKNILSSCYKKEMQVENHSNIQGDKKLQHRAD